MDRILLVSEHKMNQKLLGGLLEQQYQVILGDASHIPDEPFDLGIIDGVALARLSQVLERLKEVVAPVFLPVLLVTSRQDVGLITRHLWNTVDELVYQPVQKVELMARIEILLRARRFSVDLQRAKERVEAILDSNSDVVILTDADCVIQQVNPVFQQVFGRAPGAVVGQPLDAIATGEQAKLVIGCARSVVTTCKPQRLEIALRLRGARVFEADIAFSPILGQGDVIQGVVCSLRDIATRKELERQLRQTLEHERDLARIKSRFLSMASHEFRTPLSIIQTTTDILRKYEDRLSDEQKVSEYDRITAGVRGMIDLLDDVLTISRGEVGSFAFDPETLDLVAYCRTMVDEYRRTIGNAHDMIFSCEGEDRPIVADPKHLRHMIGNLLSNAIKYSPTGSTVTCALSFTPERVVIRVADQGIGIPGEDLARLFQSFYRAGNVEGFPGTGLGLVIAKQSAELHGGTIAVESVEDEGTTFIVELPLSSREEAGATD